jgi:hypothetical protein
MGTVAERPKDPPRGITHVGRTTVTVPALFKFNGAEEGVAVFHREQSVICY